MAKNARIIRRLIKDDSSIGDRVPYFTIVLPDGDARLPCRPQ
jgi:hypothetical protein